VQPTLTTREKLKPRKNHNANHTTQMKTEIETLTKLGLTLNQARVYLALATQNQLSAREISKNAGITRQKVYRIIPQLLNKGLAIKQLTHPATYKATLPKNALHTLLEQRKRENNQLKKKQPTTTKTRKTTQQHNRTNRHIHHNPKPSTHHHKNG
jgi:sugar-specific transcriptional regulator TrmB